MCVLAPALSRRRRKIIFEDLKIPIDVSPTLRYILLVLSNRDASRGVLKLDRARAGRTGAPRNGRRPGGQVERREAQRLPWARAVALPREVGTLIPPPRVPAGALAPPAAPPPRLGSRGTGKTRTHCAARMRKLGCLKFVDRKFAQCAKTHSASSRAGGDPYAVSPMFCETSVSLWTTAQHDNRQGLWVPPSRGRQTQSK
jgi:hypothetical protein